MDDGECHEEESTRREMWTLRGVDGGRRCSSLQGKRVDGEER